MNYFEMPDVTVYTLMTEAVTNDNTGNDFGGSQTGEGVD